MQAYLQKYNLFPKKSLCWGKIIEILLNRDFVFLYLNRESFSKKRSFSRETEEVSYFPPIRPTASWAEFSPRYCFFAWLKR